MARILTGGGGDGVLAILMLLFLLGFSIFACLYLCKCSRRKKEIQSVYNNSMVLPTVSRREGQSHRMVCVDGVWVPYQAGAPLPRAASNNVPADPLTEPVPTYRPPGEINPPPSYGEATREGYGIVDITRPQEGMTSGSKQSLSELVW